MAKWLHMVTYKRLQNGYTYKVSFQLVIWFVTKSNNKSYLMCVK